MKNSQTTIPALIRCTECGRVKRTDRIKNSSEPPQEVWVSIASLTTLDRLQIKKAYPNIKDLRIKRVLCPDCTLAKQASAKSHGPLTRLFTPLVSGARKLFSSSALAT